jgi:hypothetical protein
LTASEAFDPIASKQKDTNLQHLNKTLVNCCLSVTLRRTVSGCSSGVVLADSVYKAIHTISFNFMRNTWAGYDPVINNWTRKTGCQNAQHGDQVKDGNDQPTPHPRD